MTTTKPTTFEAHGKTWTSHTPGDPMPCAGHAKVYAFYRCELEGECSTLPVSADTWDWDNLPEDPQWEIIGWRYATPQPQEPDELIIPDNLAVKLESFVGAPSELATLRAENIKHLECLKSAQTQLAKVCDLAQQRHEELVELRAERELMLEAIQYAWEAMAEVYCPNPNDALIKRATLSKIEPLLPSK